MECLRLATQAPTGSNLQTWRWVVITDPELRLRIGDLYRGPAPGASTAGRQPAAPDTAQQRRVMESATYLRDRIQDVPVLVIPCVEAIGGAAGWAPSIYPAVWSFMLALRSRGLGSVITTAHLYQRDEADRLLGVPEGFVQACLVPVAYYTGTDFVAAVRRPVSEVTFLNGWGTPIS
jgi:nitroreductase